MKELPHSEGNDQSRADHQPHYPRSAESSDLPGRLYRKEIKQALTPEEIVMRSIDRANNLIEQNSSQKVHSGTALAFARLAEQEEDLPLIQYWTDRLEVQGESKWTAIEGFGYLNADPSYLPNLAKMYFIEASLGDPQAFQKLQTLLAKERDTIASSEDPIDESHDLLAEIVLEAADHGIPADTWISGFAKNDEHKIQLKYFYAVHANENDHPAKDIGRRYANELTDDIVRGGAREETLWDIGYELVKQYDDPITHERILQAAQETVDESLNDDTFHNFISFARGLMDSQSIDETDAEALEACADHFLLLLPPTDQAKVDMEFFSLSRALLKKIPVDELIAQTQQSIDYQLSLALPETFAEDLPETVFHTKQSVQIEKRIFLHAAVRRYSHEHDFAAANKCIHEMKDHDAQTQLLMDCLQNAQTPEEIALLKNEHETDDRREKLFRARELMLRQHPQEQEELFMILGTDASLQEWTKEALVAAYKRDFAEGASMSKHMIALIATKQLLASSQQTIGDAQIEGDDPNGFQTLYDYLERIHALPIDYVRLATRCNAWIRARHSPSN